jgi:hypothetical protein
MHWPIDKSEGLLTYPHFQEESKTLSHGLMNLPELAMQMALQMLIN